MNRYERVMAYGVGLRELHQQTSVVADQSYKFYNP